MYQSDRSENPDLIEDVEQFHDKFKLEKRLLNTPVDPDLMKVRIRFLAEELKEVNKAAAEGDLEEVLDGLVDLVYVAVGTAFLFNLDFPNAWKNVQEANMAKVQASADNPGKRGYARDIVKPPGWKKPDHAQLFTPTDWQHPPLMTLPDPGHEGLVDLPTYFKA